MPHTLHMPHSPQPMHLCAAAIDVAAAELPLKVASSDAARNKAEDGAVAIVKTSCCDSTFACTHLEQSTFVELSSTSLRSGSGCSACLKRQFRLQPCTSGPKLGSKTWSFEPRSSAEPQLNVPSDDAAGRRLFQQDQDVVYLGEPTKLGGRMMLAGTQGKVISVEPLTVRWQGHGSIVCSAEQIELANAAAAEGLAEAAARPCSRDGTSSVGRASKSVTTACAVQETGSGLTILGLQPVAAPTLFVPPPVGTGVEASMCSDGIVGLS